MATPEIAKLDLSGSDTEDLFASPSRPSKPKQSLNSKSLESTNAPPQLQRNGESKYDAEQAREASLHKELESVRSINEVIEGVVSSLESAKGNMDVSGPEMKIVVVITDHDRLYHAPSPRHLHC